MEQLFINLQKHIKESLTAIVWVDENYGQLQTQEDTYPIPFPCVLIDTPSVQWSDVEGNSQLGTVTVILSLAIDCYHDTYAGSGQEAYAAERQTMNHDLHKAVQGYIAGEHCGKLIRQSSRFYSLPGAIKVYETTYTCPIKDIIKPNYTEVARPTIKIKPSIT